MSSIRLRRLCLTAAFAALGCAMTFVHIPYPLGYLNLGDCIVLLSAVLLPPGYAMAAAGIAGASADLFLGYSLYAPATFIIKALMAGLCACICGRKHRTYNSCMPLGNIAGKQLHMAYIRRLPRKRIQR